MIIQSEIPRRQSNFRSIYILLGLGMSAYVIVGFGQSYFFRSAFSAPALRPMLHLHGLLFSAWMLLFIVQAALIGTKRYAAHRGFGIFGVGLAGAMVLVGVNVAVHCSSDAACAAADPVRNYILTLSDMVALAAFVMAGVLLRKRREWHKRLMLLATVSIIDASVLRWPIVGSLFATDNRSVKVLLLQIR